MNYGALLAEGELLAFLDDDDEWLPSYLSAQIRAHAFVLDPPVFSFTDYYLRTAQGGQSRAAHNEHTFTADLLHAQLLGIFPRSFSLLCLRRDVFNAVGGADESLNVAEDHDLYLRLFAQFCDPQGQRGFKHAPAHIREYLVVRGSDESTADGVDRADMKRQYIDNAERLFDGFFATAAGSRYRFIKEQAVENYLRIVDAMFMNRFGL